MSNKMLTEEQITLAKLMITNAKEARKDMFFLHKQLLDRCKKCIPYIEVNHFDCELCIVKELLDEIVKLID